MSLLLCVVLCGYFGETALSVPLGCSCCLLFSATFCLAAARRLDMVSGGLISSSAQKPSGDSLSQSCGFYCQVFTRCDVINGIGR